MKRIAVFGLWTCCTLTISITSCERSRLTSSSYSGKPTASQLQKCADLMNLEFPKGTRGLMFHQKSMLDTVIYLKAEIARDDLEMFLKNLPFVRAELSGVEKSISPEPELPWWQVDKAESFLSGTAALPDACWLSILVDLDSPDVCIVYLEWWDT